MKHAMLGCNIRPGHTPGSFSNKFAQPGQRRPRKDCRDSSREVCEAANRVLQKRGIINMPNRNDSTAFGGWARR